MTTNPYRARPPQNDPYANPYRIENTNDSGAGGFVLLGALALLAVTCFIYFFGTNDRETKLSSNMRPLIIQPDTPVRTPPQTTDSGSAR